MASRESQPIRAFSRNEMPAADGSPNVGKPWKPLKSLYVGLAFGGLILPGCSCRPQSNEFSRYDQPEPVPAGRPGKVENHALGVLSKQELKDCGRGTGQLENGECVQLGLRQVGYTQRVAVPSGTLISGRLPASYDAAPSRAQTALRWPDQPLSSHEMPGFWIDVVEVTRKAYADCVAKGACTPATCKDGDDGVPQALSPEQRAAVPQTCVTHAQAENFCRAHGGRLPTAREWEYAARGPTLWRYPWGDILRDEVTPILAPVGNRSDTSYFGVLGMGSAGDEWVADAFVPDARIRSRLRGDFRSRSGPWASTWRAFVLKHRCGSSGGAACERAQAGVRRHTTKGLRVGASRALPDAASADRSLERSPEGWPVDDRLKTVGFRCAADLGPEDPRMSVPDPERIDVPDRLAADGFEVDVAVVESVSFGEARRYCRNLGEEPGATRRWRLPRFQELERLDSAYPGPGPFWLAGGVAASVVAGGEGGQRSWAKIEARQEEPLVARCIRDVG